MELRNLPWYGQLLVYLIIGIVFFAVFYFLFYSDGQVAVERYEKELKKLRIEVRKAEQKKKELKKIKAEYASIKENLEKIKSILPEKKNDIERILKKIHAISSGARLKMLSFTPKPMQKKKIVAHKPISIKVDGSYHNLGIFFDQLSKFKKIFTVDQLRISPSRNFSREYTVSASFTATTYLYLKPKAKGKKRKRR